MMEKAIASSDEAPNNDKEPQPNASTYDQDTLSDDEVDAFLIIPNKSTRKKRRSKRKSVHISISSVIDKKDEPATSVANSFEQGNLIPEGYGVEECSGGDLSFFSETHEGQDPVCAEINSSLMKNCLHVGLEKMEEDKAADMAKINAYLFAKWEERTEILNKQVAKIRLDVLTKQNTQRAQLAEKHRTQQELDKRKIDEGRKWLQERQKQQLQEAQQTGNARNIKIEDWNNFSAQLQTRHAYQLKQFELKEVSMKERSANDANAQNQILEAHHKKRSAEAEAFIDDLIKQCHQRQKNLKATLTRLHEQRFEAKKREIQTEFSKPIECVFQRKSVELHFQQDFVHDNDNSLAHTAVLRHKRRKNIMNGTTVQIAVDIHNEGLFLMARSAGPDENTLSRFNNISNTSPGVGTIVTDDTSGRPCLFIPWGSKARSFLYSIVCGDIPPGYGLEKATAGSTATQKLLDGGLVKCMITDTRTSHDTAIGDRAQSYPKIQASSTDVLIENVAKRVVSVTTRVEELESDIKVLSLREQKIGKTHRDTVQHLERAKATIDKLNLQLQQFFGNDGTPSPNLNPESQQKIASTMYKYKTSFETTRNEELSLRKQLEHARIAYVSKKEELENLKYEIQRLEAYKKEVVSKSGMDGYLIDKRAENLINSICQVAQRRRAHVNRKKPNSDSNSSKSIPEDEKKSFAQKMVRRRIVTMLRPLQSSIVNEVKEMVGGVRSGLQHTFDSLEVASIDPKLRAEELLLLSLYPEVEEALAPVPNDENIPWAEPGWQINLSPPEDENPHSILPLDQEGHIPRHFLSVCCSSGRQTASLVQQRHLRMLEGPLSFVSNASAPAEMKAGQQRITEDVVKSDPLSVTDEDMRLGYSFVLRPPKKTLGDTNETEQKSPAKRSSSQIDDTSPRKDANVKRHSQTQTENVSPKPLQSVGTSVSLQQPAAARTPPPLMQPNQIMQPTRPMHIQPNQLQRTQPVHMQPNQPMQPTQPMHMQPNQPMQPTQATMHVQSNQPHPMHMQPSQQQPTQHIHMQSNQPQPTQPIHVQPNQQQPTQSMHMQPNQPMALLNNNNNNNNNIMNRNQPFMNMSPEQYQWMLQQQHLRLQQQQQQQQIQLQQYQNQQQMQHMQQQNNAAVNQGQTNNAPHSHQQQNTRR